MLYFVCFLYLLYLSLCLTWCISCTRCLSLLSLYFCVSFAQRIWLYFTHGIVCTLCLHAFWLHLAVSIRFSSLLLFICLCLTDEKVISSFWLDWQTEECGNHHATFDTNDSEQQNACAHTKRKLHPSTNRCTDIIIHSWSFFFFCMKSLQQNRITLGLESAECIVSLLKD